jgi:hypothetical protein
VSLSLCLPHRVFLTVSLTVSSSPCLSLCLPLCLPHPPLPPHRRRERLISDQLQPYRELLDFWAFLKHGGSQALSSFHYLLCCAFTGAAGLQGAAQLAAPLIDLPVSEPG